jgi:hypothetical protein
MILRLPDDPSLLELIILERPAIRIDEAADPDQPMSIGTAIARDPSPEIDRNARSLRVSIEGIGHRSRSAAF